MKPVDTVDDLSPQPENSFAVLLLGFTANMLTALILLDLSVTFDPYLVVDSFPVITTVLHVYHLLVLCHVFHKFNIKILCYADDARLYLPLH